MTGLLVQLDVYLLRDLASEQTARMMLGKSGDVVLEESALHNLTQSSGIPGNEREFVVMPVLCTECGQFALLRDVLGLTGAWGGACVRCDRLFWDKEFPAALKAMLRIDWRHAFDAILSMQGRMLVRPMLRPMYHQGKDAGPLDFGVGCIQVDPTGNILVNT